MKGSLTTGWWPSRYLLFGVLEEEPFLQVLVTDDDLGYSVVVTSGSNSRKNSVFLSKQPSNRPIRRFFVVAALSGTVAIVSCNDDDARILVKFRSKNALIVEDSIQYTLYPSNTKLELGCNLILWCNVLSCSVSSIVGILDIFQQILLLIRKYSVNGNESHIFLENFIHVQLVVHTYSYIWKINRTYSCSIDMRHKNSKVLCYELVTCAHASVCVLREWRLIG